MPQAPLEKDGRSSDRLTRTIFFLSAVLFHLVLFMAIAGYVLFPKPVVSPDPQAVYIQTPPAAVQPPPPSINVSTALVISPPVPVVPTTTGPSRMHLPTTGIPGADNSAPHGPINPAAAPARVDNPDLRLTKLEDTVLVKWGRTPQQIANHDPSCTFPVYVASYANGDWACNTHLDKDGNIVAGSIPNLVAKINEWSHGEIKGQIVPKPLDVASPELLDKMPPFIFFTGHKDFFLTEAEVANLREYLNRGGLIWGDNALAGTGSRFDVAFHREMKRVIPDLDKKFETYSLSDDIFAKGHYPISEIPAGMNYYAEMPQHLDIEGIVSILYTPNDYSDMMFMRILPGDKSFFMTYKPVPPGTLYTDTAFVEKQSTFYRNFDLQSSLAVHRLGMNIVSYLLIRFDDKLQLGH